MFQISEKMHNEIAERYIIGSIFLGNEKMEMLESIFSLLDGADFYFSKYGSLFEKAKNHKAQGKPIDNVFFQVENPSLWTECANEITTTNNALYHASTVKKLSSRRREHELHYNAQKKIEEGEETQDINEQIINAQDNFVLGDTNISYLWQNAEREQGTTFIKTGFDILDEVFHGGMERGSLLVVGAYSGEGKTAFLQNITAHTVKHTASLWFSYEETQQQLWRRFSTLGVDKKSLLIAPDAMNNDIDWVEYIIKKTKREHPFFFVYIDQLSYLLPKVGKKDEAHISSNHSLFLSRISQQLKDIAMRYGIIITVSHQLNKQRDALNYSDAIRQPSDKVVFLQRERKNNNAFDETEEGEYTSKTILKVNKNRPYGTRPIVPLCVLNERFLRYDTVHTAEENYSNYKQANTLSM